MSGHGRDPWATTVLTDAQVRAACEARRAEIAAATQVRCAWVACVIDVSATTGKILGGFGVVCCPCNLLPGRRSPYPAGLPKPAAPVKSRGRHGSKVQRAAARRRSYYEWAFEHSGMRA